MLLFLAQVLPLFTYRWVEDESWYSSTAYTLFHEGKIRNGVFPELDIESKADTRPIAMPATLALAFATFGVGPGQARLPELLAMLTTIPVVFWLGMLLGSPQAGVLAALLTGVDNMVFLGARTVRPEAFVTFFGALAILLYVLSRQRNSVLLAFLSGIAVGISCNYHSNGLAIAATLGLLLLAEHKFSIWKSRRAWALVLGAVTTLIPFCVWLAGDPVRLQAFRVLYGRGERMTWQAVLHSEGIRYADLLGFGNQRLSFTPFPVPLRLHIVLLIVISIGLLAWKRRDLFWMILALIIPSLLLWPKEVNPTVRYFAVLAPYFALAVALSFQTINRPRWRLAFACWCALVVVTEIAGNVIVLRQARTANYVACTNRLRSLVPENARVLGAITFFMALHDRTYYSWNRTPLDFAVNKLGVDYLIMNDRVLLHGSGFGLDDWKEQREIANSFVRESADLVGRVPDPFYGDLEIYRVRQNSTSDSWGHNLVKPSASPSNANAK